MNNEEKRTKVLTMIEDLYGASGMAVVNLVTDYMSAENWGHLYDRLEQDGALEGAPDDEDDDPDGIFLSEEMKEGLDYVRENIDEEELLIYRATVIKNLNHRMPVSEGLDDAKIIDLLEEYGEENGLSEGWWEEYGEIDEWLSRL